MEGISSRQGPHQVAQKLSSTRLPRCAVKLDVPPPASRKLKSGARDRAGFANPIDFNSSPTGHGGSLFATAPYGSDVPRTERMTITNATLPTLRAIFPPGERINMLLSNPR